MMLYKQGGKIGEYTIKLIFDDALIGSDTSGHDHTIYTNANNIKALKEPKGIPRIIERVNDCIIQEELTGVPIDLLIKKQALYNPETNSGGLDVNFVVNSAINLCDDFINLFKLNDGKGYPKITPKNTIMTEDHQIIFCESYNLPKYSVVNEREVILNLGKWMYFLLTGLTEYKKIREIDPVFSYTLDDIIDSCLNKNNINLLSDLKLALSRYEETDDLYYEVNKSVKPSKDAIALNRFDPVVLVVMPKEYHSKELKKLPGSGRKNARKIETPKPQNVPTKPENEKVKTVPKPDNSLFGNSNITTAPPKQTEKTPVVNPATFTFPETKTEDNVLPNETPKINSNGDNFSNNHKDTNFIPVPKTIEPILEEQETPKLDKQDAVTTKHKEKKKKPLFGKDKNTVDKSKDRSATKETKETEVPVIKQKKKRRKRMTPKQKLDQIVDEINEVGILEYLRRDRRWVKVTIVALVFISVNVGIKVHQANKTYDNYANHLQIAARSTDTKEQISECKKAIKLLPTNVDAYEDLLNIYTSDTIFDTKEEEDFQKVIHNNWKEVKKSDDYGVLAYHIGRAYWYYYNYGTDSDNEITRMKSAIPWFEDSLNYDDTKKYHSIAKIYCAIGKFNKNITLSISEGEDSQVYEKYFKNLSKLMKIEKANDIAKLELYKLIVNSIDTYKTNFVNDGVKTEDVDALRQDAKIATEKISPVTQKGMQLKTEIINK